MVVFRSAFSIAGGWSVGVARGVSGMVLGALPVLLTCRLLLSCANLCAGPKRALPVCVNRLWDQRDARKAACATIIMVVFENGVGADGSALCVPLDSDGGAAEGVECMPRPQFQGKSVIERCGGGVAHHRLDFDKKLSVLPKGEKPGLDGNLIIEGDNLKALKSLLPTHAGKVKCIYIDPPYNTGNEGWVYNDNLTQPQFKEWVGQTVGKEGEDACRHDKGC